MKLKLIVLLILFKVIISCSDNCIGTSKVPYNDFVADMVFFDKTSNFFFLDQLKERQDVNVASDGFQLGNDIIFSQLTSTLSVYEITSISDTYFTIQSHYRFIPPAISWKPEVKEYLVKICDKRMIFTDHLDKEFSKPVLILIFDK